MRCTVPVIFSSGVLAAPAMATSPLAWITLSLAGRLAEASPRPRASASKLVRGVSMVPVTTPLALMAPIRSGLTAASWRASTFQRSCSPGAPKLPVTVAVFWPMARRASTPLIWVGSALSLPAPVSGWPYSLLGLTWKSAATFHAGAGLPAMCPSALTSIFRSPAG